MMNKKEFVEGLITHAKGETFGQMKVFVSNNMDSVNYLLEKNELIEILGLIDDLKLTTQIASNISEADEKFCQKLKYMAAENNKKIKYINMVFDLETIKGDEDFLRRAL